MAAFTEPFQADVHSYGKADRADRGVRFALMQQADQVIQIVSHTTVIAVRKAVGLTPPAVVQKHSAPPVPDTLAQQTTYVRRFQIALQPGQYDNDRSILPHPVKINEITVR